MGGERGLWVVVGHLWVLGGTQGCWGGRGVGGGQGAGGEGEGSNGCLPPASFLSPPKQHPQVTHNPQFLPPTPPYSTHGCPHTP